MKHICSSTAEEFAEAEVHGGIYCTSPCRKLARLSGNSPDYEKGSPCSQEPTGVTEEQFIVAKFEDGNMEQSIDSTEGKDPKLQNFPNRENKDIRVP